MQYIYVHLCIVYSNLVPYFSFTLQIDVPEDTNNQTPGFAYEGAACRLNVLRTMRNLRLQQLVNEVIVQLIKIP